MGWLEDNGVQVSGKGAAAKDKNGFLASPVAVSMTDIKSGGQTPVFAVNKSTGERTLTTQSHAQLIDPTKYDFYMADTSGNAVTDSAMQPRFATTETDTGYEPTQMPLSKKQTIAREKAAMLEALGLGSMFINPGAGLTPWLGVPARIALAGGAAGLTDAVVRAVNGEPMSPSDMSGTALTYAGTQGLGEGMGLATSPLAEFFMHKALRPTARMLQDSPTLIEDAIKLRTKVRKVGDNPVEADLARRAAAGAVRQMIDQAETLGGHIPYADMERRLMKLRNDIALGDPDGKATDALDAYIADFKARWGGGATPVAAQALKRATQKQAKRVFAAENAGGLADEVDSIRAQANAAVAKDMRSNLNDLLESMGIRSQRGLTLNQENAAVRRARAVGKATTRAQEIAPSRLDNVLGAATAGAAVGKLTTNDLPGAMTTAGAMMGGQLLNSPQMYSNYALLLSNPNVQRALQYGPTLLAPLSTTDLFRPSSAEWDR